MNDPYADPYAPHYVQDNYDPASGVASIGYGGPTARQQMLMEQARRQNMANQNGGIAPFETASITNDRNDARQQSINSQAAAQYMAMQKSQSQESQPSMQYQSERALDQQYGGDARTPSFSRYGNQVSINGQQMTDHLDSDAQSHGMNPDDYAKSLYDNSTRDYAKQMIERRKGNIPIGTAGSKMFLDPRFHQLSPEEQDLLSEHVHGFKYSDALNADKLGGNMTVSQYRARMMAPERQKGAFDYMKGIEGAYGANSGDILSNYDPATQTAKIAGKPVYDKENNAWINTPDHVIKMPAAQFAQLRQQQAYISGYDTSESMDMADPRNKLAAMEARRNAAMQGPPAPSRIQMGGTPDMDARKQAALLAVRRRNVDESGARGGQQARQYFSNHDQTIRDAEAMKYWNSPPLPYEENPSYSF